MKLSSFVINLYFDFYDCYHCCCCRVAVVQLLVITRIRKCLNFKIFKPKSTPMKVQHKAKPSQPNCKRSHLYILYYKLLKGKVNHKNYFPIISNEAYEQKETDNIVWFLLNKLSLILSKKVPTWAPHNSLFTKKKPKTAAMMLTVINEVPTIATPSTMP